MRMKEEIIQASTDERAARGMATAAVIQAIPLLVWGFLIFLIVLFMSLAIGFHIHDMPAFTDTLLHWILWGIVIGLVLIGVKLAIKAHNIYHDVITKFQERRIGSATARRQEALAEKSELQNEQLRVRIDLERQLPAVIQYALNSEHNIEYDGKGLRVQNYLSNIHALNGGMQQQIAAPVIDMLPPPYKMSDVLQNWQPSKDGILLAKERDLITVPMGEPLCHTTFTGNTDAGKTNDSRMLLIQLLFLQQIVFICDRNYQRYRLDKKNPGVVYDYSPIESQLIYPPATTTPEAVKVLEYLISTLEDRRIARRKAIVQFPDMYLFMDELPAFAGEDKAIMEYIGRLVREARQYGIFFIGAAQDLLNQTLKNDNGAIRDNLLTNYYGGGDATTARMVLNLAKGETIDETGLGKQGTKYLRAKGAGIEHMRVRTPLSDDAATVMLLGDMPPVQQMDRLFDDEPPAKKERNTGDLPALDGDLLSVYEVCIQYQQRGEKASARKVEAATGIDKDRANTLMNRLQDMGHIRR